MPPSTQLGEMPPSTQLSEMHREMPPSTQPSPDLAEKHQLFDARILNPLALSTNRNDYPVYSSYKISVDVHAKREKRRSHLLEHDKIGKAVCLL
jgi:hypothetical protein